MVTDKPRKQSHSENLLCHVLLATVCYAATARKLGAVEDHSPTLLFEHHRRYSKADKLSVPGGHYTNITNPQSTVHSVDELAYRPFCGKLDPATPVIGKWYRERNGHFFFELDTCRLRRLSSTAARRCLAGKRLVFLGDSITRFQYLSLAQFLSLGIYQHPYDDGTKSPSNPYLQGWGTLSEYYSGVRVKVNSGIASSSMHSYGSLHCQCNRFGNTDTLEAWELKLISKEGRPDEASRQVLVNYKYVYCKPSFLESALEGIQWACRNLTSPLPTHLFLNMGIHWKHKEKLASEYLNAVESTMAAVNQCDQLQNATKYWKSTTAGGIWNSYNSLVNAVTGLYDWKLYDVSGITQAAHDQQLLLTWHKDTSHLLPVVYEQFNDLLLNMLCD